MKQKAIIVSIKGTKLSDREKLLLSKESPWGLILFKRNIRTFNQLTKLINEIKKLTRNRLFPVLIDEEGSTVSRLKDIINHKIDANLFGNLYKLNSKTAIKLYKNYIISLCKNLRRVGININTIPVLDVLRNNTNKIIGKRSFSEKKEIVRELGKVAIKECHSQKIIAVIKHIPGHGCSITDSHLKTPKVNLDKKILNRIDFYPFKSSPAKLAMTAHIVYKKIDPKNVATFSKIIIQKLSDKK